MNQRGYFDGAFTPLWDSLPKNLNLVERALLGYLANLYFNCPEVRPSISHLSVQFGVCQKTIWNALNHLEALGWIEPIRVGKKCNNRYKVNVQGPGYSQLIDKVHEYLSREVLDETTDNDLAALVEAEKSAYESSTALQTDSEPVDLEDDSIL